jgi:hypothetical protein
MAGGKGKSSGGKSSGGKTSGVDGPKKQQSHSARAGLQVCSVIVEYFVLHALGVAWGTITIRAPLAVYLVPPAHHASPLHCPAKIRCFLTSVHRISRAVSIHPHATYSQCL